MAEVVRSDPIGSTAQVAFETRLPDVSAPGSAVPARMARSTCMVDLEPAVTDAPCLPIREVAMGAVLPLVGATQRVRGACPHDCPDTCAWTVTVEDDVAVELRGDAEHPFTSGGLCAKVNRFLDDRVYHPDRLLHPLRRSGPKGSGQFHQVSWDEALAGIADRLHAVIAEHGGEAVLPYSFAGTQGFVQCSLMDWRFFATIGASQLEATVCGATSYRGLSAVNGVHVGIDPEDVVHSRFIVLWGTNTLVTNLHLWPFVQRARRDGATVVVIDPQRTRTAQAADWHIQPVPGTDAALALGMLRVIIDEGLHDPAFLSEHASGFDELRARLDDYPLAEVASVTGLEPDVILELARRYAGAIPSTIRVLIGMEHRRNGTDTYRAIAALPVVTGAWRHRGGGLLGTAGNFTIRAVNNDVFGVPTTDPGTRSINMMELGRALTSRQLDPPIEALVVYNSNPAATAPNQNLVLEGLRRDDLFTVVLEHFMTDTARHADYVLPATTQVEHLDLAYSWGTPYLALNVPAISPRGEALPNSEIFRRLAHAMGLTQPYFADSDEQLVRGILDSDHPYLEGITYESLLQTGWAKLRLPADHRPFANGFATDDGRAHLVWSEAEEHGLEPLPRYRHPPGSRSGNAERAEDYPLSLITAKGALHFLNSSYGNVERHLKAEVSPTIDIHPDDAAERGISDGHDVRVFNERGEVFALARVGDRVRPGVVALPSGWWASHSPGGSSANALTSDGLADGGRGGDFHDTLVQVSPASGSQ